MHNFNPNLPHITMITAQHWNNHWKDLSQQKHNNWLRWNILFPFYLWHLWLNRNNNIHNNKQDRLDFKVVCGYSIEYAHIIDHRSNKATTFQHIQVKWEPPHLNRFKFNIDGATYGFLGPRGIGGVIHDHAGKWSIDFLQPNHWHPPLKLSCVPYTRAFN